jgi:BirA family biotin operon repressor/biotin-[acetyl-CoA-carboxylase] ligase
MDVLAASAAAGAPEGSVVLADEQSAGRGRLGRAWQAPAGKALMLSILFRPDPDWLAPGRLVEIGMAVGLAADEVLAERLPSGAPLGLKWPNDILVEGAKLAGLLAEVSWEPAESDSPFEETTSSLSSLSPPSPSSPPSSRSPSSSSPSSSPIPSTLSGLPRPPRGPSAAGAPRARIIVGIGINVGQTAEELPTGATSLALLWGGRPPDPALLDRGLLAADLLLALERRYAQLVAGQSLVEAWSARLDTLGREVVARRGEEKIRGLAIGVERDGALRIRRQDGRVELLWAGDVSLRD